MKKYFATTLAVTMAAATLGTTAFAAESPTKLDKDNKSVSITVTGEYVDQQPSAEIISMDVAWGAMNFTYAKTQQGTWDPTTHAYKDPVSDAGWAGDTTSDIKVTNHSNVDVTASFAFAAADGYSAVTGTFKEKDGEGDAAATASVNLDAGVLDGYDSADNKTVTFTIGGEMANTTKDEFLQIGTITVSVEKKADDTAEDND